EGERPERRVLGIRCLGAIDAIEELVDALSKEDEVRTDVRQESLFVLRNWLSRGVEQGVKLFDKKTGTGLLIDKGYNKDEAETILVLLYGPAIETWFQRDLYEMLIFCLREKKIIIRD